MSPRFSYKTRGDLVDQTDLIEKKILGYTVSERLGFGTFESVYKVVKSDASGQCVRALKHITVPSKKQYLSALSSMDGDISKADNYFSQMLIQIVSEIKILKVLSEKDGQHIVRYYESDIQVVEPSKRYDIFILMEYLTPLEEFLQNREFHVRDVVQLGLDILCGLEGCHENGVIHRDVKDDSIFVSENGLCKIGDFGVSKILKSSSKAEPMKGIPNFLAPEVYLGKESYTKSTDLYSLGIVLYRLLNYSRNPFLPPFPQQYCAQDEDSAFEKRMTGQVPYAPLLGGGPIGAVILRAISDSAHRFQAADEFLNALEQAVRQTPDDVLNMKIGFDQDVKAFQPDGGTYAATAGETSHSTSAEKLETEPPMATGRTGPGKFVFFVPVIFLFVGLAAYFIVIPKIYGQGGSFFDWLFADPQNIIDTLQNPYAALSKAHMITEIRIFWYIWLAGFTASLFFVGRQLNHKPAPTAANAILVKREPYLLVCDVQNSLKAHAHVSCDEFVSLLYAVKCLAERLSIESDFGCGNVGVTTCENSIAKQLQVLSELADHVDRSGTAEIVEKMQFTVQNINSLLRRRSELEKK